MAATSVYPEDLDKAQTALSAIGHTSGQDAFAGSLIVLRHDPHLGWITMIMAGWVVGVTMQIIAGTIARLRR